MHAVSKSALAHTMKRLSLRAASTIVPGRMRRTISDLLGVRRSGRRLARLSRAVFWGVARLAISVRSLAVAILADLDELDCCTYHSDRSHVDLDPTPGCGPVRFRAHGTGVVRRRSCGSSEGSRLVI